MKEFIEKICIFDIQVFNVLVLYFALCISLSVAMGGIRVVIRLCSSGIKGILMKLGEAILKRDESQRFTYSKTRLFAIKLMADTEFYWEEINNHIFKTYKVVTVSIEKSILDKMLRCSMEYIIGFVKRVIQYFFHFSLSRIVFLALGVYWVYTEMIRETLEKWMSVIPWEDIDIDIDTVLDFGELISLLCIVIYIMLDMRHKATGYSELRQERFKELVKLEEKLLLALDEMRYSLYRNISSLSERKYSMLQRAASELSGKECYIIGGEIKFEEKRYGLKDNISEMFDEFDDLENVSKYLSELDEEYKNSSIKGSNVYHTDHNAMLTAVYDFWKPAEEGGEITRDIDKRVALSKSRMETWYKNVIKAIGRSDDDVIYFPEEQTTKRVLEASDSLDYSLERALLFDLKLKKYCSKLRRRLWKIHNYSRFRLF